MDGSTGWREILALTALKAQYCRYLDTKRWDEWRALFTDGFVSDTSAAGGQIITGADDFVAYIRGTLGDGKVTVHQVHNPEIDLTSATTATGVWALHDVVHLGPGLDLHGYGHYHETYQKHGDAWRIATSTLTRVREDIRTPLVSVRMTARLRDAGAALARRRGR
ncbi:nuclear transport factor 2 family protein [Nocardia sp. NPDC057227]|uniref:nuclear transport factor 2 family protein n=1 Tax=Nocardia sp. NPDC057227 TaxID=3346056 RepID=UPI003643E969